jgi:hypothetical protein
MLESVEDRMGLFMSGVTTLFGAAAADVFFDRVKGGDAFERLAGDRRGAGGGENFSAAIDGS